MTPEERAEQVCRSLTIREVVLTMPGGETASFEMAPIIAEAIRQTRIEALEEAAKLVQEAGAECGQRTADVNDLVKAIRQRAKE